MNHDEEYNLEQMINMMLETGFPISEIERVLGVKIHSRVLTVEYVVQVVFSPMCGEIELSMN
jgi:hypothetical protein